MDSNALLRVFSTRFNSFLVILMLVIKLIAVAVLSIILNQHQRSRLCSSICLQIEALPDIIYCFGVLYLPHNPQMKYLLNALAMN